ncbi:hypothetical protein F0562_009178 [Nyssa sinensis]|uniref:Protein FAR1-RELATED SEQUENCE n=1 Tax=Nyssa sinensis TaxID=561372 RepID=A0A5J4ZWC2_9ASTE|nr:hypothetical protein F0562_009178 [Nyssa sinensis]
MHVKRRPNGKWYIHSFIKGHNHELLPAQAHFFRSHRNVDPIKNDAKIRRQKILASVSKQHGAYQYTGCLENCIRNQQDKGRNLTLEEGDAQVLLELFVHMLEENLKFFYAVDLNEEHRLRNIFWVDVKGMDDYANFGDVISFDTTYFTDKYKIPLVLFIGVNHHSQPTLLGCALIADDTVYTFVWLMQTWCLSMGGRAPLVLLTDQHNAIKIAVATVFPETRHCFCLWHVLEKIPGQLEYLSLWHDTFMAKFNKCIYRSWTEEQFEKRWWKLVDRFNLREDEWIQSLYKDHKLWVPTFLRDISFAGFSTASRSGSLNSLFDKYFHGEISLTDCIEQYKVVLEDRYEEEARADFDVWHETPELKSPSPFEKQMSLVYTHEIFKKFQVEVLGAAACHLKKEREDETTITYAVKDFEDNQDFLVEWNESKSDIFCSCRSFEYKGYLCRHAVVVLQILDEVQSMVRHYKDLCRRAIILGEEGSLSRGSYNIALGAIKEALKQCASVNNSIENDLRPNTLSTLAIHGIEEENQGSSATSKEKVPDPKITKTNKASKRLEFGKEKASNENIANKKGKVTSGPKVANVGTLGGFHQMELTNVRQMQLDDMTPTHLHNNVLPTMFHNVVSTQFHNLPSKHLHDERLPR